MDIRLIKRFFHFCSDDLSRRGDARDRNAHHVLGRGPPSSFPISTTCPSSWPPCPSASPVV